MELDFGPPWRIVPARPAFPPGSPFPDPALAEEPEDFAAAELAAVLGRMTGRAPTAGDGTEDERVLILHAGAGGGSRSTKAPSSYSWRAASGRVEIYGEDGPGLVRGVYDFLDALGARWIEPGPQGERLPSGQLLPLAAASRRSPEGRPATTLILGHGAFLERWEDYLAWAARAGYASVFIHTTRAALAIAAAPESLYESLRGGIAALARKLGLGLELGGHLLPTFVPRALFKGQPGLFRQAGEGGERRPDGNFCASNARALELAGRGLAEFARAHAEVSVFHAWPEDLPGGGWCSCPDCAARPPAAQSLAAARALAAALAEARPGALLSFLAYHDTEDLSGLELAGLPPNLELLWAPRRRCWAHGLDEGDCALDAASSVAYRAAAAAWRAAGGGPVAVFEYWEDAILFKGAVPPLPRTMAGDLAVYADADAVGVLLAGGRLPLAPRPNQWLLPRLAGGADAAAAMADWIGAAYGPAAAPLSRYWEALDSAWAIDLDLEPGDTRTDPPAGAGLDPDDPPTDWGDPWPSTPERLAGRVERCDELFDRLREAEDALTEALELAGDGEAAWAGAVRAESLEYAIAGNLLELDCARLAAYSERAAGQAKAASDIALLARSPYAALSKALSALPDRRSRREIRLLLHAAYGIRLGAIRREARRDPLAKALGRAAALAELGLRALPLRGTWARPGKR